MARVGLWKELEHHLGTIDVVPIMGLRWVRPIAMNRYSEFMSDGYIERWGCVKHGRDIEINSRFRRISFKVYNLGKRLCIYSTYEPVMKTLGFSITFGGDGGARLKWKRDLATAYEMSENAQILTITKWMAGRQTAEISHRSDWNADIYYGVQKLIKMMESM